VALSVWSGPAQRRGLPIVAKGLSPDGTGTMGGVTHAKALGRDALDMTGSIVEDPSPFDYPNLSGRPAGPFVSLASRFMSGVREVQAEIEPYAAAWRASNARALADPEDQRPLWAVLGDSLSQGIGASAFDRGWVGEVQRGLAAQGHDFRVLNLSMSGARVQDLIDRQVPALSRLAVTGVWPSLATVLIGSNDLVRKKYRLGLAGRFHRLLDLLPAGTVVANLPNPRQVAQEVNELILTAVRERGLVLADLRAGRPSSWRGKLAADHFHPNDLGYAGMAAAFTLAIAEKSGRPR
jgi:lysophospholipase L1-like esterase